MKLYSRPVLKYRTKDRLHICKESGLLSWMSLICVTSMGIFVDFFLIPDYFVLHAGFLLMCLMLSLNIMKTWDLIMDREENLGTMISRNWYHIFSIQVPEENVQRFPLSSVSAVTVTSDNTIDLKRKNNKAIQIVSESSDYRLLRKLREEISGFLYLERLETLNSDRIFHCWDIDPWSSSSIMSDSQESDNDNQDENPTHNDLQFHYGSNIKIITGIL